jgi:hypothetical protein
MHTSRFVARTAFVLALATLGASSATAQRGTPRPAAPSLIGTWTGTATIPLADSAMVVPVSYTFTQGQGTIGGTATVPGQQSGPITAVVRDSSKVTFRVTVPQGALEHEAKFAADGSLEGSVSLNNLRLATIKLKKQG